MRDTVLRSLQKLNLRGCNLSDELPFDSSGTSLPQKNPRVVYVDQPSAESENVLATLGGKGIDRVTHSVDVVFTADAKQLFGGYADLVKDIQRIKRVFSAQVDTDSTTETEYVGDLLITTVTISTTELET